MVKSALYAVDMGWGLMLNNLGIRPADILRQARLPLDLFQREAAQVTSAEYFRLWLAIESVSGDPHVPLKLAEVMSAETFSPVLFACLCSNNLDGALSRLASYKPLIGPMRLTITKSETESLVQIEGLPGDLPLPPSLVAMELVFLTHLARLGLRDRVVPASVESPVALPDVSAYAQWFGCKPRRAESIGIAFHRRDAEKPFLTAHPAMWAAFEPSLRLRLSDATAPATMTGSLTGWLNESIASGRTSVQDAARDLCVSTRTLQRRLSEEGTSFQAELLATRKKLANHYLTQTKLSTAEIAFLLGYSEQNSFYRAFHEWSGSSPERARQDASRALSPA